MSSGDEDVVKSIAPRCATLRSASELGSEVEEIHWPRRLGTVKLLARSNVKFGDAPLPLRLALLAHGLSNKCRLLARMHLQKRALRTMRCTALGLWCRASCVVELLFPLLFLLPSSRL